MPPPLWWSPTKMFILCVRVHTKPVHIGICTHHRYRRWNLHFFLFVRGAHVQPHHRFTHQCHMKIAYAGYHAKCFFFSFFFPCINTCPAASHLTCLCWTFSAHKTLPPPSRTAPNMSKSYFWACVPYITKGVVLVGWWKFRKCKSVQHTNP